jgi:Protein of unknown function (DUF3619)
MNHGMLSGATAEQVEARFALRITALLSESAQSLPVDVTERLRVARQNAVQQATAARVAAAKPVAATSGLSWIWNRVAALATSWPRHCLWQFWWSDCWRFKSCIPRV